MKCISINCNNKATIYGWCDTCLDELGDFIEKNPIGCQKEISNKVSQTENDIDKLFNNFKEFLKEKNRRYGDAALYPINIFSKSDVNNQICNRLDDKLNRIKNFGILKKNDISDVFGYIVLLLIQNKWTTFDEQLD